MYSVVDNSLRQDLEFALVDEPANARVTSRIPQGVKTDFANELLPSYDEVAGSVV
jgi:hypothetical protein